MGTKHITNEGLSPIYVGGLMIAPGEGRDIDEQFLPPEHRDAPVVVEAAAPSLDDLLAGVLAGSVATVKAQLPELTHEALDRMTDLEGEAAHPRKTLLEAIGDEKIRRADAALQPDDLNTGA